MSVPPIDGDESDTDTIDGASEVDASEDVAEPSFAEEPDGCTICQSGRSGCDSSVLKTGVVMRSVPRMIRGAYRNALRVALEEVARD